MKLIVGGLTLITILIFALAISLVLGRGTVPSVVTPIAVATSTVPGFTPVSTGTPAPLITPSPSLVPPSNLPQVIAAPNEIIAGSSFAIFGSNWTPNDSVSIFLRDPARPSDPILPIGSGQVKGDGTLAATVVYPTDPRWANLTQADIIVQAKSTGVYVTASVTVQAPTPVPPTSTPTATSTRVPPTVTPTRVPATATPQGITSWRGEYYANATLTGAPVVVRNDPDVNFYWGSGAPAAGLPIDNFSARWTRQLSFAAKSYRFTMRADDGVRVWIDNALIIDEWHIAGPNVYTRDVNLAAGSHALRVEYYEATGDALIQLKIEQTPQFYPDWKGEYFNNRSLSGAPVLTRDDVAVSFDWGTGSPADNLPADGFSVRWTRTATFDGQTYNFSLRSDDGMRFYVDGSLVIDEWHDSDSQLHTRSVFMSAGPHTLQIEYFEHGGRASMWFTYQSAAEIDRWKGEYFANNSLAGYPTLIRNDDRLDFDWGAGKPDQFLPPDNFSVRWTRSIDLDAGLYQFDMTADDAVRFYVDGTRVLNEWHAANNQPYSVRLTLAQGRHDFKIEYAEFGGNARFSWTRTLVSGPPPTATKTPTPSPTFVVATVTPSSTPTRTPVPATSTPTQPAPTSTPVTPATKVRPTLVPPSITPTLKPTEVPPTPTNTPVDTGYWHGEYYSNMILTGTATLIRNDPAIKFNWREGAPDPSLPADQFSVRWTRTITFTSALYHFTVKADDGVRVTIDGHRAIDEWHAGESTVYSSDENLTAGPHVIVVEYYEDSGGASVALTYESISDLPFRRYGGY